MNAKWNGPVGSNHGNLQNTPLLALGYRALRELPRCILEVTVVATHGTIPFGIHLIFCNFLYHILSLWILHMIPVLTHM